MMVVGKGMSNMKFGVRTPSLKKSISARTTGWITNPRKAAYNKIYRKTTVSFWDLFK